MTTQNKSVRENRKSLGFPPNLIPALSLIMALVVAGT